MSKLQKFFFILFFLPFISQAAEIPKRALEAERTNANIRIDGSLDEEDWVNAKIADKFTTTSPIPGQLAEFETQVRILYNDNSMYIGAFLIDPEPDKIMKQLTARDQTGNASFFSVVLDTYNSGINGFGFSVTSAGVQSDFQISSDGEDDNWDAVWKSSVKITEYGWVAEMEIPYSALRFPENEVQNWNINFGREVRRTRERSFWNEIDPQIEGFLNQAGMLTGIKNIETPIRLMITPYISYGGSRNLKSDNSQSTGLSGGMDLKYGLSDAFTLDMTLIPDFSQVRFDEEVLNLSPFEVQFDENRAFFTEGTELFNKANLFYSRRIGSSPINRDRLYDLEDEGYTITSAPRETQLINATKLSGRLNNGLGIGVFNAIVGESFGTYKDENGKEGQIQTSPLTNYNVAVADKLLRNNSYISFINTNVWRSGDTYEANVTGTEFSFRTEDQQYELRGSSALSQKYYTESSDLGYKYNLSLGKVSGATTYGFSYSEESPEYDINDLGFIRSPNERSLRVYGSYNNFKPKSSRINRSSIRLRTDYRRLVDPNVFTDFAITANGFVRTSNFIGTGGFMRIEPVETFDYFEPRTSDYSQYLKFPTNFMLGSFLSTNYNNPFAIDLNGNFRTFNEKDRNSWSFEVQPRWRVSDKLNLRWSYDWRLSNNDVGYVTNEVEVENVESPILFGKRDRQTAVNEFTAQIIFNENMYVNLIGRHYWSKVNYNNYHLLGSGGELIEHQVDDVTEEGRKMYDVNFNLLNVDLVYNWRFAPGSDLVFVIKNFANNGEDIGDLRLNYKESVQSVYEYNNNFSMNLKVLYFIDYFKMSKKITS